nr:conotoxin [Conus betulinus]
MEGRRFAAVLILAICLLAPGAAASRRHVLLNVCILPAITGPCKASMQRYYFDVTSYNCKTFIYGGCLGNGNNFHTYDECFDKCG